MKPYSKYAPLFAVVLLAALFPFMVGVESYWITVFIFVGIYTIVTIGLSLLMGYAGQISLGHGAFFGIGAYTSGLLTTLGSWNPWLAIIASLALSCFIAALIGYPTLRLRGHYLAMATLAFGEIVVIVFTAEVDLTGGPSGFGGIPRLSLFGLSLKNDLVFYYFVWSLVCLVSLFSVHIIHSRMGRALQAIHSSESAANAMGVDTAKYKLQIFVFSAALASFAGSLYAHYMTFVSPTACELKLSIMLVVMVAIGGMSSIWGAIIGTVLITSLPEFLGVFEDFDILVYGAVLVIILLFSPDGLFGGLKQAAGLVKRLHHKEAT